MNIWKNLDFFKNLDDSRKKWNIWENFETILEIFKTLENCAKFQKYSDSFEYFKKILKIAQKRHIAQKHIAPSIFLWLDRHKNWFDLTVFLFTSCWKWEELVFTRYWTIHIWHQQQKVSYLLELSHRSVKIWQGLDCNLFIYMNHELAGTDKSHDKLLLLYNS